MIKVTQHEELSCVEQLSDARDSENKNIQLCQYRLASQCVQFQSTVNSLNAFKLDTVCENSSELTFNLTTKKFLNKSNTELIYQGMAQFEGRVQEVMVWSADQILQINVSGQAICHVDVENEHIHVLNNKSFDERLNLEVVTGPALIMLIAQLGTFCLHAGAVSTPYGNMLIIAESGLGKSTLSADAGENWRQLTDDISPLVFKENSYQIENFPQLKLINNVAVQPFPEQSTIDLIIRLNGAKNDLINFKPLNKTDALLQFVRHTVAAKLFDAKLLNLHAEFASNVASSIPMVELSYPRDLSKLGELRESICDYLRNSEVS